MLFCIFWCEYIADWICYQHELFLSCSIIASAFLTHSLRFDRMTIRTAFPKPWIQDALHVGSCACCILNRPTACIGCEASFFKRFQRLKVNACFGLSLRKVFAIDDVIVLRTGWLLTKLNSGYFQQLNKIPKLWIGTEYSVCTKLNVEVGRESSLKIGSDGLIALILPPIRPDASKYLYPNTFWNQIIGYSQSAATCTPIPTTPSYFTSGPDASSEHAVNQAGNTRPAVTPIPRFFNASLLFT